MAKGNFQIPAEEWFCLKKSRFFLVDLLQRNPSPGFGSLSLDPTWSIWYLSKLKKILKTCTICLYFLEIASYDRSFASGIQSHAPLSAGYLQKSLCWKSQQMPPSTLQTEVSGGFCGTCDTLFEALGYSQYVFREHALERISFDSHSKVNDEYTIMNRGFVA